MSSPVSHWSMFPPIGLAVQGRLLRFRYVIHSTFANTKSLYVALEMFHLYSFLLNCRYIYCF